jgi:hypothetical protein
MLKRTCTAASGSSCCVPASSTPHDETTARKVRENPVLSKNQQIKFSDWRQDKRAAANLNQAPAKEYGFERPVRRNG